jgi:plasmid stabilization system protein ParE
VSGFKLHPEVYNDLEEIWEFTAEDNLDAADRVREGIYTAIKSLVSFPRQGHRRTDLTSRPLRFLIVRNYLIAYAPEESTRYGLLR